jgi:hypothetical protein
MGDQAEARPDEILIYRVLHGAQEWVDLLSDAPDA